MSSATGIPYLDAMWPVVTGCSKVSESCRNCWACRLAATRLHKNPRYAGLAFKRTFTGFRDGVWRDADGSYDWTGDVKLHPDLLDTPLRWRKPRKIGVCFTGDLFHENVPDEFIDKVMEIIAFRQRHTFLILTKRPGRMREYFCSPRTHVKIAYVVTNGFNPYKEKPYITVYNPNGITWPLPNLWLGVTAENQEQADIRIPHLLQIPAAVRFVSIEPMLGPISFRWAGWCPIPFNKATGVTNDRDGLRMLDWIICGGESGPNARPMDPDWARLLRDQCQKAGVPFWFKQWGEFRLFADVCSTDDVSLSEPLYQRVGAKAAGNILDGERREELPGGTP